MSSNELTRTKGDAMAIKVLITRTFKPDNLKQASRFLMELRSLATLQKGYMSGETLVSANNPNKLTVVSTWISQHRWEEWQASSERKAFAQKIEPLLESAEQTEVFMVGEKSPEWVDMA
jgi:quinol monooxygenase YgiN